MSVMMNMFQYRSLLAHNEYSTQLKEDNTILEKNMATLQRGIQNYQEAIGKLIAQEKSDIVVLKPENQANSPATLLINRETEMMYFTSNQ